MPHGAFASKSLGKRGSRLLSRHTLLMILCARIGYNP